MAGSQKVVVVTGGSRGIGRAICLAAVEAGYAVAFSYLRDDAAADDLSRQIARQGGSALAVKADVGSPEDVARMFEAVDARYERLDALVNNAGISGPGSGFMDSSPETVERVFRTNVLGLMTACRHAIARMSTARGGDGGSIVNISSGAAQTGSPNTYVWYAASKGAVESFSAGLAKEVAREGIRVNVVSPGVTNTEIHASAGRTMNLVEIAKSIPLGRIGEPEEIARPVLFLLSDAASYMVGATLRVGGGR